MLLVIDAGNSEITFGLWDRDALTTVWRCASRQFITADQLFAFLFPLLLKAGLAESIRQVAIASVVPQLTPSLEQLAQNHLHVRAPFKFPKTISCMAADIPASS